MRIEWKSPEDRARVWNGYRDATKRRQTEQRDRYNAVLLLGDGGSQGEELEGDEIARRIGRSPRFVDKWQARYCSGGFDAIVAGKATGKPPKLTSEQDALLKARIDAGPTEADGVCTLRGVDIVRIVEKEFGVIHTLGGIYDVLARIGYSSLVPRPSHAKKDPQAVVAFVEHAPFFVQKVREDHPGKTIRFFVSDEARVGQKGTLERVWAPTGSRPTMVKQCEYDWVYLWAAVDPFTGDSIAMITPTVNAELMQLFIQGLSDRIGADDHAILVLDNAGWHHAKSLVWPQNVTPMFLPPYSPELNPSENVWQFLRSHQLSNQMFADYDAMLHRTDAAWDSLDPARLRSLCRCHWIERAIHA